MQDVLFEAGMKCLLRIGKANDGQLPRTLQECRALPEQHSLLLRFYDGRTRLLIRPDGQGVIYANPTLPVMRQMCDIIHEIAEWIAIENNPTLFDGTITTVYHADGGSNPKDMRHQVALFVERVYRAWLEIE